MIEEYIGELVLIYEKVVIDFGFVIFGSIELFLIFVELIVLLMVKDVLIIESFKI